ncbi:MAG: ATP-dependent Clp protease adapter ClpS [Bdellovibrionales bacterium]|nr:ATP-dependent Clp protease adapter ClpS [Bdellovibrionales bacterium]
MRIWSKVLVGIQALSPALGGGLPPSRIDGHPLLGADNDVGDIGSQTGTLTKSRSKTKEPSLYKVVLLNDDFTPMDFVVQILKKFFGKSEAEANNIMLQVHNQGAGIAGVFSHEIAETKVYLVHEYSRQSQHPLKCVMEKA